MQIVLRVSNSAGTVSRSVPVGIATLTGKWESQGGGQTLRMVQVNDTFTGTYTSMTALFNLLPVTLTVSPESPGTVDGRGNFSAVFTRMNLNGTSPSIRGRLLFTGVLEYKVDNAGPFINVQTGRLTRVSETP